MGSNPIARSSSTASRLEVVARWRSRDLIEWWAGLITWLKLGVALLLLTASTTLWLMDRFWPWDWVAGGVLLLFSCPSQAQRKGYHDF